MAVLLLLQLLELLKAIVTLGIGLEGLEGTSSFGIEEK
ncbi:hypothetical protein, glimmer [Sulfolobus islandicus M.14.25]|uniref:Uncharacterized protein n=2 Tax=Saccharolobus islandicus TaxID=43080 RepID=C3MXN6_SACI4|nr:hypothetical protein, glimmer [Sulfolobus islandicus M.14.25]ACP54500.1 hypothetical protein M1627_2894 [Sulfolobus islandicus M.16.27]